jgi:hypothetical protein
MLKLMLYILCVTIMTTCLKTSAIQVRLEFLWLQFNGNKKEKRIHFRPNSRILRAQEMQ